MGLYKALPVYRALPTVVLRPMPEISLACCCAVLFPKAGHVFPQQGLPDRWERRGGLLRSSPPTKWTRSIDQNLRLLLEWGRGCAPLQPDVGPVASR